MTRDWIFLPVFVQVLLTLMVFVLLGQEKKRAVKAGTVDLARRALHEDAWPESVQQINNNIRNQFELPVLFYVLSIVLWELHASHQMAFIAASLFVASRIVHAWIHLGKNEVPWRRKAFTFGWIMLAWMTGLLAWELVRRAAGLGPY
jgi:hypothetical protein